MALALLVLNDHLLKGSGVLPASVTGKLSDVAGLVVAPVLVSVLAALAGFHGRTQRFVCYAVVVVTFSAVKVSEPAARALEAFLSLGGVRWRLWSDPTDLTALVVLPAAWRTSSSLEERLLEREAHTRHVLGAMLGGLACLATSISYERYRTSAWLVSKARASVIVEVSRAPALDCDALDESVAGLTASDFEPAFCADLEPATVLPLDRDFSFEGHDGKKTKPAEEEPPCDAVLIGVAGLKPTIVSWSKRSQQELIVQDPGNGLHPAAVYLEPAGSSLLIASSKYLSVREFVGEVPNVDCASLSHPEGIP
ncbi:MAG TPA: hypothetical protein VFZ53_32720 [Polyangiaceae bacterium]